MKGPLHILLLVGLTTNGFHCTPELSQVGTGTRDADAPTDTVTDSEGEYRSDVDARLSLESLTLEWLGVWGGGGRGLPGDGDDEFRYPSGIALSPDGNELYVYDGGNERVKVLSLDGRFLRSWRHASGICGMNQSSVAIAVDGTVYVTSEVTHGIIGYSPTGEVRAEWALHNAGDLCELIGHGHGLSITADGVLLVTEYPAGVVQQYTLDGVFIGSIGEAGFGEDQFGFGPKIAADVNGVLYVSDMNRFLLFGDDGMFVDSLIGPKDEPFMYLEYGLSTFGQWLVVIRTEPPGFYAKSLSTRQFTHRWSTGEGPQLGRLRQPWALAIDREGNWYVTELYNHRIQIFRSSLPSGGSSTDDASR